MVQATLAEAMRESTASFVVHAESGLQVEAVHFADGSCGKHGCDSIHFCSDGLAWYGAQTLIRIHPHGPVLFARLKTASWSKRDKVGR